GGLSSTGNNTDLTARTMTINVTSVNDPPVATLGNSPQLSVLKNTTYPFTRADFHFSDPLDNPQNAFKAVIFTAAPTIVTAAGSLLLNGAAVPLNTPIDVVTEIDLGHLVYTAPVNPGSTTDPTFVDAFFRFKVQDAGSGTAPDVNTETTDHLFNIHVTPAIN